MTEPKSSPRKSGRASAQKSTATLEDRSWWRSPSLSVNWKALGRLAVALLALSLACARFPWGLDIFSHANTRGGHKGMGCYQAAPLTPARNGALWDDLKAQMRTEGFRSTAVHSLQGAVQIRTESFDDMGAVGEDPRWEVFAQFRAYLETRFPLVHANLELTPVNTHGLFYQWKGSDATRKPILLAAHQDVVPVENATLDRWTHPPYEGHYDGSRIWGRGSSDDKSQLISILSSVELLLEKGFRPTRTVVLAFGFDEEAGGLHGAQYLADHIMSVYGHDGIAMIVDEGAGFFDLAGATIAIPGVAERGVYNIRVDVYGPGGHSSMPPKHTTIGLLVKALEILENQPFSPRITAGHPVSAIAQCLIPNVKILPRPLQPLLKVLAELFKFQLVRDAVVWGYGETRIVRSLVQTSQAISVIGGGVKSNALPEKAWAVINHRVSVTSSLAAVQERYIKFLRPLAAFYGMSFEAFGERILEGPSGYGLSVHNATLHGVDPAPISPTGPNDLPFQLLSGTIKASYGAYRNLDEDRDHITVAPGMMPGNTDTKHYWKLSRHIFRYNHHYGGKKPDPSANGIHTVDEFIAEDVLVQSIGFFVTLILNADDNEL